VNDLADQADGLRRLVKKNKNSACHTICVTGAKGGVGKSSVAVNLAIAFQKMGKEVIIIDADFGLANVDVMLGVKSKGTFADIIERRKTLRDVITVSDYGVKFISGGSGVYDLIALTPLKLEYIMNELLALEDYADIIIFDTAAGISNNVVRVIESCEQAVIVTTPEPTAIMDAYALIKIVNRKKIDCLLKVVINKASSKHEAEQIFNNFSDVIKKYLHKNIESVGYIAVDKNMSFAISNQKPLLIINPNCQAANNINALAGRLINETNESQSVGLASFFKKFIKKNS